MTPRTLIFDYGNTLIEFGPEQVRRCDEALASVLDRHLDVVDREQLRALRTADRDAVYGGDPPSYRESCFREITVALVRRLGGGDAEEHVVEEMLEARSAVFREVIEAPDYLHDVLDELGARYRLALLSNYPSGEDVRASLDRIGITEYFESIVVSGEVGYVKPHPLPFRTVLEELGESAGQALFVGDNWLADIQGPKRLGMQAAWTRQFVPVDHFERADGDHAADLHIDHLRELLDHL